MPTLAVLLSGGLDSAVLLVEACAAPIAQDREPSSITDMVHPIYVSVGLAWEAAERRAVELLLASGVCGGRVGPLVSLGVDMSDVYPATHWAREGRPPAYDTPDEDVYLVGRNIVLLGKAGVYCAGKRIDRLLQGTLGGNPFPDATPAFRQAMARALALGLDIDLSIEAPYAELSKAEVIRRGIAAGVPLALTLSCMCPGPFGPGEMPSHCGRGSKCRERHDAFVDAGLADPTRYVSQAHVAANSGGASYDA